jgi:hypothetical protein
MAQTRRFTSRWHIEVSKKQNSHGYPSERSFVVATSSTTRDNATSTPKLLQLTMDSVNNCQWVCLSIPSKTGTTSAAGGSLATIAELVELIILNLGYHNMLRVCLVSPFWCAIIHNSQSYREYFISYQRQQASTSMLILSPEVSNLAMLSFRRKFMPVSLFFTFVSNSQILFWKK